MIPTELRLVAEKKTFLDIDLFTETQNENTENAT